MIRAKRFVNIRRGKMALAVHQVILLGAFILLLIPNTARGARNDCDCYEFGTEQTSLGVSIYDSGTCQCKCKPNVEGKKCDRCKPGFYNIKTRYGCEPCLCNPSGAQNQRCDATTGRCSCREGFSGYRCNLCQPLYFRKSQKQCVKCNCNFFGSKDLQCDKFGRCPCHNNVEGKHCNRCRRFTHNLTERCPQCPACYQKINESLSELKKDLLEIRRKIENPDELTKHDEDIKKFADQLRQIHAKALAAKNLMKKLKVPDRKLFSELQKKTKDLSNEAKTLLLKMQSSKDPELLGAKLKSGEEGAREISDLITSAEASVLQANLNAKNISDHNSAIENLAKKGRNLESNMSTYLNKILHAQNELNETCKAACEKNSEHERIEKGFHQEMQYLKGNMSEINELAHELKYKTNEIQNTTDQCNVENEENVLMLESLNFPNLTGPAEEDLHRLNEKRWRNLTAELDRSDQYLKALPDIPSKANRQLEMFNEKFEDSLREMRELDAQTDDTLQEMESLIDKYANISDYNKPIEKSKADVVVKLEDAIKIRDKIDDLVSKIGSQNDSLEESRVKVNRSQAKFQDDLGELQDLQRAINLAQANFSQAEKNLSNLLAQLETNPSDLTARLTDVENWRKQVEDEAEALRKKQAKLVEIKEHMLKEADAAVNNMKKNIQALADIIEYLSVLPVTEEEFALIEEDLRTTEDILRLHGEVELLKEEVEHVKKIVDAIPDGDYCPESIDIEQKNLL